MITELHALPSTPCVFSPTCVIGKGGGVVKSITKTIEFTKDPIGYIATQEQKACVDIANQVFPAFVKLLHPDLTVDWFLGAYKVSFAIGLILFGFLLLSDFLSYRRGQMGPSELLDNLIFYVPAYIIGALIGPAVGNFLCQVTGALCEGLIGWAGGSNGISGAGAAFTKLLAASSPGVTLGGAVFTALLFFIMMIAFVLILVTLLFMFVTLYLSGAVFPVGWAWIVKGSHRKTAWKIVNLWVGILASQPLVFFMLAVVMKMVSNNLFGLAEGGAGASPLTRLVGLIGGCMALLMVAAGPFTLNKLAPIGVGGSTDGASLGQLSSWAGKGTSGAGARGGAGESSDSDSQMGQVSRGGGGGGGGGGGEASGGEAMAGGEAAGAAAGPLGMAAMAVSEQSGGDSGGVGGDTLLDKATGEIDQASSEVSGQMDDAAAVGGDDSSSGGGSSDSSLGDAADKGGSSDGDDSAGGGSQGSLGDAADKGGSSSEDGGGAGGSGKGNGVSLAKASEGASADGGGAGGDDSSSGGGGFGSTLMKGAKAGGSMASSMAEGASSLGSQIAQNVEEHADHQHGGHDQ